VKWTPEQYAKLILTKGNATTSATTEVEKEVVDEEVRQYADVLTYAGVTDVTNGLVYAVVRREGRGRDGGGGTSGVGSVAHASTNISADGLRPRQQQQFERSEPKATADVIGSSSTSTSSSSSTSPYGVVKCGHEQLWQVLAIGGQEGIEISRDIRNTVLGL
jgi:hypothetical protein